MSFDLEGLDEDGPAENILAPGIDALFGSDDDDEDDMDTMVPEPDPEPEPEPEPDPEPELDPGAIIPTDDPDLSQEDLDSLFDENDATDGIPSMVESSSQDAGIDNLDDIPDPEPLPKSLTGGPESDEDEDDDEAPKSRRGKRPVKKAKKGGKGLIILLVLGVLLGGLGGGMFFLRDMIVRTVPALGMVYNMVGLGAKLGEGLEIRDVKSERGTEGGIDFLMLSGNIVSTAGGAMPVPLIKALLIDANGEIIQSVIQEPGKMEIPGGGELGFAVKIEEPSPLARRLEVTFEPRPEPEG